MTLPVTDAEILPPAWVPRYGPFAVAAFIGLVVCSNLATILMVKLDSEHPARLLLLSARNRFLVVTVPSGISPFTWTFLAVIRVGLSALVCHLVGRAYGDRALRWFWRFMGMPQEQVAKFEKAFDTAEWVLVPFFVGSNIVWVLSGAARTSWKRLLPLFAVGLAARLALLWWLAKQFKDTLDSIISFGDRYQWWVLGASLVIVVLVNVRNLRPQR